MAVKPQPKQDANKPREEGAEPLMDGMPFGRAHLASTRRSAAAKTRSFLLP